MYFLSSVITGLLAGWLAGKILRGHGFGPPMDMGLGIVGGVSGGVLRDSPGFIAHGSILLGTFIAVICVVLTAQFAKFTSGQKFSFQQD